MSELKACPFCGSEQPQDSKDDGNVPYEFGMSRSCNSCSAAVNLGWNTRPIEDELQKRIAELEGFIGQLIKAGNAMSNAHSMWVAEEDKWDALVKDWEEREG